MTVKTSVSLTDRQSNFARGLVEAGRYSSVSAVIQQGLDELQTRMDQEQAESEAFIAMLKERDKGPMIPAEEFSKRIDVMLERKKREYGLED